MPGILQPLIYPENLTPGNLAYFLAAPTLVSGMRGAARIAQGQASRTSFRDKLIRMCICCWIRCSHRLSLAKLLWSTMTLQCHAGVSADVPTVLPLPAAMDALVRH